MRKLLIIDDEPAICSSLRFALEDTYQVWSARSGAEALRLLAETEAEYALLDLHLGQEDGMDLLKRIRERMPDTVVIVMTAYGTIESSVAAMKAGAYHYLTKPLNLDEVRLLLDKAAEYRRLHHRIRLLSDVVKQQQTFAGMVGQSPAMQMLFQRIEKVKDVPSNVLITGESGTGKELVARAIHFLGARGNQPFSVVNCAAIPETLLESELFGYEKGAFTGALQRKEGIFSHSQGGTVFLDEIGEMPLSLQAKILRVIQERMVTPIGSREPQEVDVRIIAATNRNLQEEVAKGTFREDLYYRLNVIPMHIPPLRERREDVPLLIDHFLDRHSARLNKPRKHCRPEVQHLLYEYPYPGNVRELANILEYAVALSQDDAIALEDLPPYMMSAAAASAQAGKPDQEGLFLPDGLTLREVEKRVILHTLERTRGHRKRTADLLGISERGLRQKLKQYGQQP